MKLSLSFISLLATLIVSPATSFASPVQTHIICHSINDKDQARWNWALIQHGQYFKLNGNWTTTPSSGKIFAASQLSASEIEAVCNETFKVLGKPNYRLTHFLATNSRFHAGHPIVFPVKREKIEAFPGYADLYKLTQTDFEMLAQEIMTSGGYQNVLSSTLVSFLKDHPEVRAEMSPVVDQAQRYAHKSIEWKSTSTGDQVLQFVEMFQGKSDFEILSRQLHGTSGTLKRGPFNTFIDLAVDSFQPADKKLSNKSVKTFDPSNANHMKTHAIIQAFSAITTLKGYLELIDRLPGDADSEALEQLQSSYFGVIGHTSKTLKTLSQHISSENLKAELKEMTDDLSLCLALVWNLDVT